LLAIRRPDGRDLVPDAEGEPRAHAALRVDHPKIQAAIRSLNHGDDPLTVRRDLEASERRCLTNRPDPLAFPVEPGELTILATAGLVHEQAGSCKRESAGGASRVELHALGDWRRLTDGPQSPDVEALNHQVPLPDEDEVARLDVVRLALVAQQKGCPSGLEIEDVDAALFRCGRKEEEMPAVGEKVRQAMADAGARGRVEGE